MLTLNFNFFLVQSIVDLFVGIRNAMCIFPFELGLWVYETFELSAGYLESPS